MRRISFESLGRLVRNTYGEYVVGLENYEYIEVEQCGNGYEREFNVTGVISTADEKLWINRQFGNLMILNRLCHDGHIKSGTYVVMVHW